MGKWNAAANEIFLQALELDSPDELQTFLSQRLRNGFRTPG